MMIIIIVIIIAVVIITIIITLDVIIIITITAGQQNSLVYKKSLLSCTAQLFEVVRQERVIEQNKLQSSNFIFMFQIVCNSLNNMYLVSDS